MCCASEPRQLGLSWASSQASSCLLLLRRVRRVRSRRFGLELCLCDEDDERVYGGDISHHRAISCARVRRRKMRRWENPVLLGFFWEGGVPGQIGSSSRASQISVSCVSFSFFFFSFFFLRFSPNFLFRFPVFLPPSLLDLPALLLDVLLGGGRGEAEQLRRRLRLKNK